MRAAEKVAETKPPEFTDEEWIEVLASRERCKALARVDHGPQPPSMWDEHGRLYALDDPAYQARREEFRQRRAEWVAAQGPVPEDPPDADIEGMRGIDEERARLGMRLLFEGYY